MQDLKTDVYHAVEALRRSGSDYPLMYGRTAVDSMSVVGSLSGASFMDFVMLATNVIRKKKKKRIVAYFPQRKEMV